MTRQVPAWRSLLYIPANNDRYLRAAVRYDADAIILDLEDSIAESEKVAARACLPDAASMLNGQGFDVVVRVNSGDGMVDDMEAATAANALAIDLPKVTNAHYISDACEAIAAAEARAGRASGSVKVKLLLESAEAFLKLLEIAEFIKETPRIVAMTIGNEDLATALSLRDKSGPMVHFYQQLVVAAGYCGVLPLGMPGDVTDYRNLDEVRVQAEIARNMGVAGSSCIHPSHIAILNEVFGPSGSEISDAQELVAAAGEKSAQGIGVFTHNGRMVDEPVVVRARKLLQMAERMRTPRAGRSEEPPA